MLVEAHWSVLKRNYLVVQNRPRIESVVYVISSQMILNHVRDYYLCLRGLKKGHWWK